MLPADAIIGFAAREQHLSWVLRLGETAL